MTEARDANPFAQPAEWARADKLESELATLRAEHDRLRADYDKVLTAWAESRARHLAAESSMQALRQALEELAIDGVTSGASPKKEGGMHPPLWHMSCKLCGARWSGTQWKQPREHPPSPASSLRQPCILAALALPGEAAQEKETK